MNTTIIKSCGILIVLCMISLQSFAQNYYEYTIEGKDYKYTNEGVDFTSSVTPSNTTIGEHNSKQLNIFLQADSGLAFSLSVMVTIEIDKEFTTGSYKVTRDMGNNKILPIAHFTVTQNPGTDNTSYFESKENSTGTVVISTLNDAVVEGTFDGNVFVEEVVANKIEIRTLKISKGKFRFPAENLRFYH